jgi:HK97 family phage portal protein
MSVLFGRRAEVRAVSFQSWWGSGSESPNVRGDSLSVALSLVPVYAATSLIADHIASSPWAAFEKLSGVPKKLEVQPSLMVSPGVHQLDLFSWKHQLCTSLGLWGNAYGFITSVDATGMPAKVIWLRPDQMRVDESGSKPVYYFNGQEVDRSLLIHIPLYVVPGSVVGLSPIGLFRTQIETSVEAQKATKNFFRRGGVPSAILKNTQVGLTADQAQETKKRFVSSVSASEPFVTGKDWDYQSLAIPTADASFLMGIKATATQIAAIYRVSPEDVGGETSSSSLTYKNLEQDMIRFNVRTLRPYAARIEAVTDAYLLDGRYVKFNLDAAVRADLTARYAAHEKGIKSGFETIDEARALEERAPLTTQERDEFLELVATTKIGTTP